MASPIETVLSRLDGVRKAGKSYKACCPAHKDRTPSLSLKEGDDGRVLIYCFGGCSVEAVVAAMGLQMVNLFQNEETSRRVSQISGVNIQELRVAEAHERQILYFVKSDQVSGRAVSQFDWDRAKLALQRIAAARRIL